MVEDDILRSTDEVMSD